MERPNFVIKLTQQGNIRFQIGDMPSPVFFFRQNSPGFKQLFCLLTKAYQRFPTVLSNYGPPAGTRKGGCNTPKKALSTVFVETYQTKHFQKVVMSVDYIVNGQNLGAVDHFPIFYNNGKEHCNELVELTKIQKEVETVRSKYRKEKAKK